ncbi:MAG TPA: hypothetical protein VLW26_12275 [Steroidobacteraceae bacterium]|nr:hypothetical protein [Steroidobacteraceae bacterium]
MKKLVCAIALGLCALAYRVPSIAADVGFSLNVGEPGFFGQIDVGDAPKPELVYPRAVVVHPEPQFASAPPVYLHVRPGYEKHWSRHCSEYHACGRPVYFVRDDWYNKVYVPHYHHEHADHHDHDRDHDGR